MGRPLTIIVGGYIVGYPLGGMTWHHLNYLLGLASLGHEVWFYEDSGEYYMPYNPVAGYAHPDPAYGIEYLKSTFAAHGLPLRYAYYSQFWDTHYGMSRGDLDDLFRRADLMLCVSGVTPIREDRPRPRRLAVIDTDPVFTQLRMIDNAVFADYYRKFDAVATFGTLIGTPASPLPTHGIEWIPTRQPIALDHWPVTAAPTRRFTSIGKWEHSGRDVAFGGKTYRSSKGPEWLKLLDLPSKVGWELDLAMQAMPEEVAGRFRERGWTISAAEPATITPTAFGDFIRRSAGELTVAKQIYAGLPSGWFSDRSSAYLASGRPVVTQRSGFEAWMPTGEGLFGFASADEAAAALGEIDRDYPRHSAAARRLAETHLDAKKVLTELIGRVM